MKQSNFRKREMENDYKLGAKLKAHLGNYYIQMILIFPHHYMRYLTIYEGKFSISIGSFRADCDIYIIKLFASTLLRTQLHEK